jgi:hypothetical protein
MLDETFRSDKPRNQHSLRSDTAIRHNFGEGRLSSTSTMIVVMQFLNSWRSLRVGCVSENPATGNGATCSGDSGGRRSSELEQMELLILFEPQAKAMRGAEQVTCGIGSILRLLVNS